MFVQDSPTSINCNMAIPKNIYKNTEDVPETICNQQ